jgi:predicted RNase H-like HicB family nuclease
MALSIVKYSVNIKWSEVDESFIATIPEFPYLSGFGETRETALREVLIALEGILEDMIDEGEDLPEPDVYVS